MLKLFQGVVNTTHEELYMTTGYGQALMMGASGVAITQAHQRGRGHGVVQGRLRLQNVHAHYRLRLVVHPAALHALASFS